MSLFEFGRQTSIVWSGIALEKEPFFSHESSLNFKLDIGNIQHWHKCSLISNFIGQYFSESYEEKKQEINSMVSTITNELLENAVKFSPSSYRFIGLSIQEKKEYITVLVTNTSKKKHAEKLKHCLELAKSMPLDEFFHKRILFNAENDIQNSEIGLISLMKDFPVCLGAQFSLLPDPVFVDVSLMAIINLEVFFD